MTTATKSYSRQWLFILALNALLWLILGSFYAIAPDMADHWMWSRELHWGYYEHPPMIALFMKLFTGFTAEPIWWLRFGAVVNTALVLWLACTITAEAWNPRTALYLLLLLLGTLFFNLLSLFWHIQPMLLFWLVGLWCALRLERSKNPNWLLLFGIVAGLGGLSKYVFILLYLSGMLWLLCCREMHFVWRSWQLWSAPLLSLLVFSPNLYWNATHEWASIAFHFDRGVFNAGGGIEKLAAFSAGHLLLFNLLLVVPAWWWLIRRKLLDEKENFCWPKLLALTTIIPLILFSSAALMGSQSDPLWTETAYLGLFMLVARALDRWHHQYARRIRRWLLTAWTFNLILLALLLAQIQWQFLPLKGLQQASRDLVAWDLSGEQLAKALAARNITIPRLIITREFQMGGSLSLYLPQHPFPFTLEKPLRNQWGDRDAVLAQDSVLLFCRAEDCDDARIRAQEVFQHDFARVVQVDTWHRDRLLRSIVVYQMSGK